MNVHESVFSKAKNGYRSLPIVTKVVLTGCVGIYFGTLLTGFDDLAAVCMSPQWTFGGWWQLYRIFTSTVFHVGFLHTFLNMLTFVPIGQKLERQIGSCRFGYIILLITVLQSVAFTVLANLMQLTLVSTNILLECAVGFSGTLFGLITICSNATGSAHQSIFGLVNVQSRWYPWILLIVWQVIMPKVSFLGHLSGLLIGQMWVWGWLKKIDLSAATTNRIENYWTSLHRSTSFVSILQLPTSAPEQDTNTGPAPSLATGLKHWYSQARTWSASFTPGSSFKGRSRSVGYGADVNNEGRIEQFKRIDTQPPLETSQSLQRSSHITQQEVSLAERSKSNLGDPSARRAAVAAAAERRSSSRYLGAHIGDSISLEEYAEGGSTSMNSLPVSTLAAYADEASTSGRHTIVQLKDSSPFSGSRGQNGRMGDPGSSSSGVGVEDQSVVMYANMLKITEMGFEAADAQRALQASGGNVEGAVELLTTGN